MRVILWSLLVVLVLLAGLAAGGVIWRTELAGTAARLWLDRQGFPAATLDVRRLTLHRLDVRGLDLGDGAPAARSVQVRYTPRGVLAGEVESIEVVGLSLGVNPGAEQPLGRIQSLVPADDAGNGGGLGAMPEIRLRDAHVAVQSPHGMVDLIFDADLSRRDDRLTADLRGQAATPHTTVEISLAARDLSTEPALHLEARGETMLARAPWPAGWPVTPQAGRAMFNLTYNGPLPTAVPHSPTAALRGSAGGRLSLTARDAELPPYASGFDAEIDAALDVRHGGIVLRLTKPVTAKAATVHRDALVSVGLAPELADLIADVRRVSLSPWTQAGELLQVSHADGQWQWDGRATLRADTGDGQATARLGAEVTHDESLAVSAMTVEPLDLSAEALRYGPTTLDDLAFEGRATGLPERLAMNGRLSLALADVPVGADVLERVSFEGPVTLRRDGGTLSANLAEGSRLRVPKPPAMGAIEVAGPVELAVRGGEFTLREDTVSGRLTADPGAIRGTIRRVDAPDFAATITPGPVAVTARRDGALRAEAKLGDARVHVEGMDLRAGGLDATLAYGAADKPLARITLGTLEHDVAQPAFAPLSLSMTVHRQGTQLTADGSASVRGTDVTIPLAAQHDLRAQSGRLTFGPAPARFQPGGLQPAALSPLLGMVQAAEGGVEARGELSWRPGGFESGGELRIDALTFETPQARVEGLAGTITASRLIPPLTPPGQELTAGSVVAGVPLENVSLRFQLDTGADGEPRLRIARAEGTLSDGLVFAEDVTLSPAPTPTDVTVRVKGLSLQKLFAELDVEGLSGEGILSGRIPVRFGGNGITVERGELAAESDGVIRVRVERAKQALAAQGEQVQLMLRALENFRYKELRVTIHRPAEGELELGIVMEGRNPDVLDGYPFRFNISLSGDLEPILAALQEGRRLTSELLQRAIELE